MCRKYLTTAAKVNGDEGHQRMLNLVAWIRPLKDFKSQLLKGSLSGKKWGKCYLSYPAELSDRRSVHKALG